MLLDNSTDTRWFQAFTVDRPAVCFLAGRSHYWHPNRRRSSPTCGQVVLYLGPAREAFCRVFGRLGATAPELSAAPLDMGLFAEEAS